MFKTAMNMAFGARTGNGFLSGQEILLRSLTAF
jgi:hypothetical protein